MEALGDIYFHKIVILSILAKLKKKFAQKLKLCLNCIIKNLDGI